MSTPQESTRSQPQPAAAQPVTPNQYHLHGGGLSVSYFPEGFGPVTPGSRGRFTYQDTHRSLNFTGDQVRTAEVPDLGTVVSVTLVQTVDVGNTTFSLLLPHVNLAQAGVPVSITTEGVTTVHRAFVLLIGHAQRESYTVTPLQGTALRGILPL